jgi:hypothetical protein
MLVGQIVGQNLCAGGHWVSTAQLKVLAGQLCALSLQTRVCV